MGPPPPAPGAAALGAAAPGAAAPGAAAPGAAAPGAAAPGAAAPGAAAPGPLQPPLEQPPLVQPPLVQPPLVAQWGGRGSTAPAPPLLLLPPPAAGTAVGGRGFAIPLLRLRQWGEGTCSTSPPPPPPPPPHLSAVGAAVGEGMGVAGVANPPALLPCCPVRPARPAALCAPSALLPSARAMHSTPPPPPPSSITCCRCSSGGGYEGGGCVASPAPPPTPSPTAAAAAEGACFALLVVLIIPHFDYGVQSSSLDSFVNPSHTHSSSFPPTTAPFPTLHLDVWGPSPVLGPRQERYFLIVVDDYSRYTTFFPL
ncbi:unnamed protein product [Closterium sp. NIES-53]